MAMKIDEYRVEEYKHLMTSSDSLIELPKSATKLEVQKLEKELEMTSIEKFADFKSKHSRDQKKYKKMGF